ncbi:hypothetical protein ACFXTO_027189 [Malus domestica]
METQSKDGDSLEKRPGVFFLGSPGVGKRSLISRLLGLDFDDASDSSSSFEFQDLMKFYPLGHLNFRVYSQGPN